MYSLSDNAYFFYLFPIHIIYFDNDTLSQEFVLPRQTGNLIQIFGGVILFPHLYI